MFKVGEKVEVDAKHLPFEDTMDHYEEDEFLVLKIFNSFIKIKLDEFRTKIVPKKACTKIEESQYSKQKSKLKL